MISAVSSVFTVCAAAYVYTSVVRGTTIDIITNKMREELDDFGDSGDKQLKVVTDTWNAVQVRVGGRNLIKVDSAVSTNQKNAIKERRDASLQLNITQLNGQIVSFCFNIENP